MSTDLEDSLVNATPETYQNLKKAVAYSRFLHQEPPAGITALLSSALMNRVLALGTEKQDWLSSDQELQFAQDNRLSVDYHLLQDKFSRQIALLMAAPDSYTQTGTIEKLEMVLTKARRWNLVPELTVAQNMVFSVLNKRTSVKPKEKTDGDSLSEKTFQNILFCAYLLGINIERWKNDRPKSDVERVP